MRNLIFTLVFILIGCGVQTNAPQLSDSGQKPPASTEVGNGGHGIIEGEKLYLFDLWEAGIEQDEMENSTRLLKNHPKLVRFFQWHVKDLFSDLDRPFVEALSLKMAELYMIDPILGLATSEAMELHVWSFTTKPLKRLPLNETIHEFSDGVIVQLANRSGRTVYLNQKAWEKLDMKNKIALVFHEIIFSMLQEGSPKRVRQLTALFSGKVPAIKLAQAGLANYLSENELPIRSVLTGIHGAEVYSGTFTQRMFPKFRNNRYSRGEAYLGTMEWVLQLTPKADHYKTLSISPSEKEMSTLAQEACALRDPATPRYPLFAQRFVGKKETTQSYILKFEQQHRVGDLNSQITHQPLRESIQIDLLSYDEIKSPLFNPLHSFYQFQKFIEKLSKHFPKAFENETQECEYLISNMIKNLPGIINPEAFIF